MRTLLIACIVFNTLCIIVNTAGVILLGWGAVTVGTIGANVAAGAYCTYVLRYYPAPPRA